MTQHRYWDFGSPIPAVDDNTLNRVLNSSGVYQGLDLIVDSITNLLTIQPGFGLQPNGVVWEERATAVNLSFIPPGAATNYTVVATHIFQSRLNGTAVEYSILIGELTSVADGVVLGWIYHPGGGAPIANNQLQSAPKQLANSYALQVVNHRPIELIPEFPRSYYDVAASGLDVTFQPKLFTSTGQFLIYQRVSNSPTAISLELAVQHFQFYVAETQRPDAFEFYLNVENAPGNSLTVQVYGTDQVLVPVSGSPIGPTTGWETKIVNVDRLAGTFDVLKPYTMRLVYNLAIGKEILLGKVKTYFWPYPSY